MMNDTTNNGGPAFPGIRIEAGNNYNPPKQIHSSGMTLRDYFAAKAMPLAFDYVRRINTDGYEDSSFKSSIVIMAFSIDKLYH